MTTIMKGTSDKEAESMRRFFNRHDVNEQIEIQKRSPYGSAGHRNAFLRLKELATEIGAGEWFGDY